LVVNVAGGVGPFTYALDGNAAISSASTTFSFANVTPGTHTILVTDSNNCTSTIPNIVIAPAVAFNVSLLQDLTCLVDASIGNPVITGGYGTHIPIRFRTMQELQQQWLHSHILLHYLELMYSR
jgi:hypothetical protein